MAGIWCAYEVDPSYGFLFPSSTTVGDLRKRIWNKALMYDSRTHDLVIKFQSQREHWSIADDDGLLLVGNVSVLMCFQLKVEHQHQSAVKARQEEEVEVQPVREQKHEKREEQVTLDVCPVPSPLPSDYGYQPVANLAVLTDAQEVRGDPPLQQLVIVRKKRIWTGRAERLDAFMAVPGSKHSYKYQQIHDHYDRMGGWPTVHPMKDKHGIYFEQCMRATRAGSRYSLERNEKEDLDVVWQLDMTRPKCSPHRLGYLGANKSRFTWSLYSMQPEPGRSALIKYTNRRGSPHNERDAFEVVLHDDVRLSTVAPASVGSVTYTSYALQDMYDDERNRKKSKSGKNITLNATQSQKRLMEMIKSPEHDDLFVLTFKAPVRPVQAFSIFLTLF